MENSYVKPAKYNMHMSKVIGLKENLNLSIFLKFFLQSYIARQIA